MKNLKILLAAALVGMVSISAMGQSKEVKVTLEDPEIEVQKTPEFSASNVKGKSVDKPREWLEVEVAFTALTARDVGPFIDSLEFKYYLWIDGEPDKILVDTVTHVNVPVKTKLHSVCYVSPASLAKILKEGDKFSARHLKEVAIEVTYNSANAASYTSKGKFWEGQPPVTGMILNKSETPFALLWWDRYADLAKGR